MKRNDARDLKARNLIEQNAPVPEAVVVAERN
jgi:hypothetical protein